MATAHAIATACYALAYEKVASRLRVSSDDKRTVMGNEKPWANVRAFRDIGAREKLTGSLNYMARWRK